MYFLENDYVCQHAKSGPVYALFPRFHVFLPNIWKRLVFESVMDRLKLTPKYSESYDEVDGVSHLNNLFTVLILLWLLFILL